MPDPDITPSDLLIVDDEREHAQVMCEALTRQGHNCDVTYNLAEAKSRLDRKRYDVIVTDMVMDGRRDGLELLRISRQIDPPPPLILVTAHSDVPTCKQALNEGAYRSEEHTSELQSPVHLVCRLLLEKKKKKKESRPPQSNINRYVQKS